jgi:hypothetical protein
VVLIRKRDPLFGFRLGLNFILWDIALNSPLSVTYDHRLRRIGHPVRSAIHKPQIGRLVVGWVTTSEYLLLYVFRHLFLLGFCAEKLGSR